MLITAENSHLSFNKFNHLIKKSAGTLFSRRFTQKNPADQLVLNPAH